MLHHQKAFSSFSVPDIAQAKEFYGKKLGLKVADTPEGGLELKLAGGASVFVYPSTDFEAPYHTVLNFVVDDIDAALKELTALGIRMEQYDLPDLKTDAKGVFRGETGPKAIAWFKDPVGHVLSVLQLK